MVSRFDPDRPNAEFGAWLNRRMAAAGVAARSRATTLARLFGVSQQVCRRWLSGQTLPETRRIVGLVEQYGSADDLDPVLQRQPKHTTSHQVREQPAAYDRLAEDKQAVVEALDHLTADQRATVRRVIDAFAQSNVHGLKETAG